MGFYFRSFDSIITFTIFLVFVNQLFGKYTHLMSRQIPVASSIKSYFLVKNPKLSSLTSVSSASSCLLSTIVDQDGEPSQKKLKSDHIIDLSDPSTVSGTSASGVLSTSHSPTWQPLEHLDVQWRSRLGMEFEKSYFKKLQKFLDIEITQATVYPPINEVFTAFNLCSFENCRVVIIGQDPYHGPGQANGLAFSVRKGVAIPPSLQNMIKEAKSNVGIAYPGHGSLENWSKQGVLLLNTCLTVKKGEANSHQKRGWEEFTDAVIRELSKKDDIVYLLWGKPAQAKCSNINRSKNVIITSSHPSPLAAYKTDEPFIGSKCFLKCNDALIKRGQLPIDWSIM